MTRPATVDERRRRARWTAGRVRRRGRSSIAHGGDVGVRALPRLRARPAGAARPAAPTPPSPPPAQASCEAAHVDVGQLPPPIEAATPPSGPTSSTRPTQRFATMLDDLEADRARRRGRRDRRRSGSPTGAPTSATASAYADALRTDPEARLLVTAKDREQITEYIDAFAADNHMTACATPHRRLSSSALSRARLDEPPAAAVRTIAHACPASTSEAAPSSSTGDPPERLGLVVAVAATAPGGARTRWRTSRWRWSGSRPVGVVEHVDVEVDGRGERRARPVDAGLLLGLPERDRAPGCRRRRRDRPAGASAAPWRGTAAARCRRARVDHRGRPGEVALEARAVQRVGVGVDEGEDLRPGSPRGRRRPGGRPTHGRPGRGQVVGRRRARRAAAQRRHAGLDRWSDPGVHQRHGRSAPTRQPDAGADGRDVGRWRCRRRRCVTPRSARDEVGAVVGAVEPEGLAQAGRAGAAGRGRAGPSVARARIVVEPGHAARRPGAARPPPRRRRRRRRWRTSACRR